MYLILYDITETSIRTKVAKLLEREGFERIQFSVFIAHINPKYFSIWKKLTALLKDTPNNKIYSIKINKENFYNMKIIGNLNHDLEYLSGDKSSLII